MGVETGGAQLGDRLVGRCQRDHVAAGIELSARGGVQRGGLAEPGRRDERAQCATLPAQDAHRARPGRHPTAWVRLRSPGRRHRHRAQRGASRPGRGGRQGVDPRTARCSTVDHSGGRRRSTLGASRTTSPDARNRSDTATISSVVSRPAESAATRSTTWASPNRESPAHKPVAGSTSAANNAASSGTASRSSPRPTTRSSTPDAGLESDRRRFAVPAVPQPLRRQRRVLALAGRQRCPVVGAHPFPLRRERQLAARFEAGLDRDACVSRTSAVGRG